MAALKIVLLAAILLGLVVLISCNDSDEDEKRPNSPSGTAQSANQKPGEKPDADEENEGEEGPRLLQRSLPKRLLHNRPWVGGSHTTSTAIRPDRCLRNST